MAIDGDLAVIGAWGESHPDFAEGAAYVYEHAPGGWSQTARLVANDAIQRDQFVRFVGISGSHIVVGTGVNDGQDDPYPAAYLYTLSGDSWSQSTNVPLPGNGIAVAIDDQRLLAGNSQYQRGAGVVYSYRIVPEPTIGSLFAVAVAVATSMLARGRHPRRRDAGDLVSFSRQIPTRFWPPFVLGYRCALVRGWRR